MRVADRLLAVRQRVHAACLAANRDPGEVHLIAVSKTQPIAAIEEAQAAGQLHFGESYAQELRDKAPQLAGVNWHFIGRVQKNKAKYIAPHAIRVHALERLDQAQALAKRAPGVLKCLISVNLAGEAAKTGVPAHEALDAARQLATVDGIEVVGLMTLPPQTEDPADAGPYFERLADLASQGRGQGLALHELSMGMTRDFEVAIAHGATWIRVGTAIFGPRQA